MTNPWTTIPLADHEAHMALPTVGQAALIANELARAVAAHEPRSVAVLGCAGGNGLERLIGSSARRIVAVDINPDFAAATEARFRGRIAELEVVVADVEDDSQVFDPVAFIHAALLLEYVDLGRALSFMRRHCRPEGTLAVLLQLPSTEIADITPSPYVSLRGGPLNPAELADLTLWALRSADPDVSRMRRNPCRCRARRNRPGCSGSR